MKVSGRSIVGMRPTVTGHRAREQGVGYRMRARIASRRVGAWIAAVFNVQPGELQALAVAFAMLFFMFASYALMRPVRETMGITGGFENIPYLFWGTFVVMLAAQPAYGWLTSRFRRTQSLPWVYLFFALNILAFWLWFNLQSDHTWIARAYFVWLSVFNLFVVAVFWSLMADIFTPEQAGRMFGAVAAGASVGGLVGPILARLLVEPIGTINLLLVSMGLLLAAIVFLRLLIVWHRCHGSFSHEELGGRESSVAGVERETGDPATRDAGVDGAPGSDAGVDQRLGGSALAAFRQVLASPYLLAIATFVFLLSWISTFVYLEQQKFVAHAFATPGARTAFFATVDAWVQALALMIQLLLFGRLQQALRLRALLVAVPVIMTLGYVAIGLFPVFAVVVGVMIVRRVGEYAITRPCRDTLFTVVGREEKYKAKSLIDTFIYRGGDVISGSLHKALTTLGLTTAGVGWAGAVVGVLWTAVALTLGRRFNAPHTRSTVAPDSRGVYESTSVVPNTLPY